MSDVTETELLRARWRRNLPRFGIDSAGPQLAFTGLADRLDAGTVQIAVQPADPERDAIRFDDAFWEWFDTPDLLQIDDQHIRIGNAIPTAHAAAIADVRGDGSWSAYLGVHRSGTLETGLGARGGYVRKDRAGRDVRILNLISTVGYVWVALTVASEVAERWSIAGPWSLTVACADTEGALLGNTGEGWNDPLSTGFGFDPMRCGERTLVWSPELDDLTAATVKEAAFDIGDRLVAAWGQKERLFLDRSGDLKDQLDPGRVAAW